MSEWVVKMVISCVEYFELKSLMEGWMDGRMDGWMEGWMDGWVDGKAGLRIAYSNQKNLIPKLPPNSNFLKTACHQQGPIL